MIFYKQRNNKKTIIFNEPTILHPVLINHKLLTKFNIYIEIPAMAFGTQFKQNVHLRFALGTTGRRQLHHLRRALVDQEKGLVVDGRITSENQLRLQNGIEAHLLGAFATSDRACVVLENVFVVLRKSKYKC